MTTFDMNNATDRALKMDVYAIYLRKSRADLAARKAWWESEALARYRKILEELASRKGSYIDEILGYGNLRYAKRRERGITIVGKKKKSSWKYEEPLS